MTPERKEIIKSEILKGLKVDRHLLTKSEREEIINDTVLNDLDIEIAKLAYLKGYNNAAIADILNIDQRTVQKHLKFISPKLCQTLLRFILGNM